MTTPATTDMVQQMNRYFQAVSDRLGSGVRLLLDDSFDETQGTTWSWDLSRYIKNPTKYDFMTCRISIFFTAADGTWAPAGLDPSEVIFKYTITSAGALTLNKVSASAAVNPPYRIYVFWPSRKYVPIPINPDVTFAGEITGAQLISMSDLTGLLGVTEGTGFNLDTNWLKFGINNSVIYIAKKPIRHSLSWSHLNSLNLINGDRVVTIGDNQYKVRLMRGINDQATAVASGYDTQTTWNSEWNHTLYHVHSGTFTDPKNTLRSEGITSGDLAQYGDADLGVGFYQDQQTAGVWTTGPRLTNIEFSEGATTNVVGNKIYVIGGYGSLDGGSTISLLKQVNCYDTVTKSWSRVADLPVMLYNHSSVVIGNKIHVFTGATAGGLYINKHYVYDVDLNIWSVAADYPILVQLVMAAECNGLIYAFGGMKAGGGVPNAYVYDSIADSWSVIANLPSQFTSGNYYAGVANSVNGKIYIKLSYNTYGVSNLFEYDPISNQYTQKTAAPHTASRDIMPGAVVGDNIYYIYTESVGVTSFIYYDTVSDKWVPMPNPPFLGGNDCLKKLEYCNGSLYSIYGTTWPDSGNALILSYPIVPALPQYGVNSYCANNLSGNIVGRGLNGISYVTTTLDNDLAPTNGWRPVLELVGGQTSNVTFEGEITGADLIDMSTLTNTAGITEGTPLNLDSNWLKFTVNNKTLYVAKKPIRRGISWNNLSSHSLVDGSNVIQIGSDQYKLRLLSGVNQQATYPVVAGYDTVDTHNSEWNQLMYHIHSGTFTDPNNTLSSENITAGNLAQYSDTDLGLLEIINGTHQFSLLSGNIVPAAHAALLYKNNALYVYSGSFYNFATAKWTTSTNTYKYDLILGTWEKLNYVANSAFISSTGKFIYNDNNYFYGITYGTTNASYPLMLLDPETNTYIQVNTLGVPLNSNFRSSYVIIDNVTYGIWVNSANSLTIYSGIYGDPTKYLSSLASPPSNWKISGFDGNIYNYHDKILWVGTFDGRSGFTGLPVYDIKTNTWSTIMDNIPYSVWDGFTANNYNAFIDGDYLYLPYGEYGIGNQAVYDLLNGTITYYVDGAYDSSSCILANNTIYSFGGIDNANKINRKELRQQPLTTINYLPNLMLDVNGNDTVLRDTSGISSIGGTTIDTVGLNYTWRPVLEKINSSQKYIFNGEVTGAQLISMSDLITQTTLSGTSLNINTNWLKFIVNGKPLYVAKKPVLANISYADLVAANVLDGTKTITIGNDVYKLRVLSGGNNLAIANTSSYDGQDTTSSEWNELFYRIHSKNFIDPWNTMNSLGNEAASLANYTDDDLGLGYGTTLASSQLLNSPVPALWGSKGVVADGKFYSYGGIDSTGKVTKKFLCYDIKNQTWETLADGPMIAATSMCGAFKTIYAHMSVSVGQTPATSTDFYKYDTVIRSWTKLTSPPVIFDTDTMINYINNKVYAVFNKTLYIYDTLSDTWGNIPIPGQVTTDGYNAVNTVTDGDNLYLIGGVTINGDQSFVCKIYNPGNDVWLPMATYPGTSSVIKNLFYSANRIMTMNYSNGENYLYDTVQNKWTYQGTTGLRYGNPACANYGPYCYFYGGKDAVGNVINKFGQIQIPVDSHPGASSICGNVGNVLITRGLRGVSYLLSGIQKSTKNIELGWRPVLEYYTAAMRQTSRLTNMQTSAVTSKTTNWSNYRQTSNVTTKSTTYPKYITKYGYYWTTDGSGSAAPDHQTYGAISVTTSQTSLNTSYDTFYNTVVSSGSNITSYNTTYNTTYLTNTITSTI